MNEVEIYVREQLRRIERDGRGPAMHAARWRLELRAGAAVTRRPLAAWLGDRLVTAGERLRAWSVTEQPHVYRPQH